MNKKQKPEWIDISIPIQNGMVHWPGDPAIRIQNKFDLDRGDPANVSIISMGSHTGTHMDAPYHYLRSGKPIDRMPLSTFIGPARIIEIRDPESIKSSEIQKHDVGPGERILFKTRNSKRCWKSHQFIRDFVSINREAASYLAKRRIRAVGVDYLSVGSYQGDGAEIHKILLKAGIWILEGLNLSKVNEGKYELLALPLKITGGDGAPARALLRRAI